MELGCWEEKGLQKIKRIETAQCVDEERNGVNVRKRMCFSERKRESHGCRV